MEKIIDGLYKLMGVQGTALMAEALLPYFGINSASTCVEYFEQRGGWVKKDEGWRGEREGLELFRFLIFNQG
jgi:hypothetical protein